MALKYKIKHDSQLHILPELVEEHMGYKEDGCFVEVGAYDGFSYNSTWGFSKAGWKGLYIEPLPSAIEKCKANHVFNPNIEYEECAASDYDGWGKLYVNKDTSTTLLNAHSRAWGASEKHFIRVPVKTMSTILLEHEWPRSFDLAVVDVEEAELRVLSGWDLGYWRPKMLVIELHELTLGKGWKAHTAHSILAGWGYRKIYADEINSIFLL
jgi:FkbM family methyltransferase